MDARGDGRGQAALARHVAEAEQQWQQCKMGEEEMQKLGRWRHLLNKQSGSCRRVAEARRLVEKAAWKRTQGAIGYERARSAAGDESCGGRLAAGQQ